jgi:hypothetical protein
MKREAMAGILDDFVAHIVKMQNEQKAELISAYVAQANETADKLRKAERCLYGTLAVAGCSLVATVVMAVTR